ncbi:response regulator transcription factor [Nitrospirillum sp. BR 11164]|uniref:response regulator transcription factor n=1 Tax=Nitrospirillum sp. BR 11164 TaxID=3104324 RepID=UPI002AFDD17A|nr:response regulator transcription factor [Nitrospirillum sp. BR 11164]MEA1648030.1 response regulator transcription factor [Nitrospirillum sp. BR 11164]
MTQSEPAENSPIVYIVDDDEDVRGGVTDLFCSVGLPVKNYASTQAFLADILPDRPSCLILDVRLPGESGLEFQARLNAAGTRLPIIFISGHADVPMSVQAMKSGAVDFLPKPFREQELLDAVSAALRADAKRRVEERDMDELRLLASQLTPREVEVLRAVDRGLLNKQIAHELGIAEITVKIHRSSAFRKLKAKSITDLVQKVRRLDLR